MHDPEHSSLPNAVEAAKRAIFAELSSALALRQRRRRAKRAISATLLLVSASTALMTAHLARPKPEPRVPDWCSIVRGAVPGLVEVVHAPAQTVTIDALDDRALIAEFAKDGDVVGIVRTEDRVILVGR